MAVRAENNPPDSRALACYTPPGGGGSGLSVQPLHGPGAAKPSTSPHAGAGPRWLLTLLIHERGLGLGLG